MPDRKNHTTRDASYPKQHGKSGHIKVEIKTTPNGGGGTVDPTDISPVSGTGTGLTELDGPRSRGGRHD